MATAPPPFATAAEVEGTASFAEYHMIQRKTGVTEKAGKDGFDESVYLANRSANQQNMAASKARNNGSEGGAPFSLHAVDPAAAYAREFHLQEHGKPLPDKIGTSATFDAEAYRDSLAANQALQLELRSKKHGSAAGGGAGGNSGSSCPFATEAECGAASEQWQRVYHAKPKGGRGMADKVGAERSFDPATYSANITANRANQAASALRSFVGSGGGDLLAFQPQPL